MLHVRTAIRYSSSFQIGACRYSQTRRVLLVGVPALIELPSLRLVVALGVSVVYLVIQHEYKPYATAEYNFLASLAGAQITATLLFISMHASGLSIPRALGFLCIGLNVILLPLCVYFNARRLRRRANVLNAFMLEHKVENRLPKLASLKNAALTFQTTKRRQRPQPQLKRCKTSAMTELLDPSNFSQYWTAGLKSEYEIFCATLKWVDDALQGPVAHDRWAQILFILEQLPLTCTANADVRHGALDCLPCCPPPIRLHIHRALCMLCAGLMLSTQTHSADVLKKIELAFGFGKGERWFGTIVCDEQVDNERVRSGTFYGELVLISKRRIPRRRVRVNSKIQELTLLDENQDGTDSSITIPYEARVALEVAHHAS